MWGCLTGTRTTKDIETLFSKEKQTRFGGNIMNNCPNCAAPYDAGLNQCPYCGTSYFDLTAIDFTSGEPVWLKIKYPNTDFIMTICVLSKCGNMELRRETAYIYGYKHHEKVASYVVNTIASLDISFDALTVDGKLFTIDTK